MKKNSFALVALVVAALAAFGCTLGNEPTPESEQERISRQIRSFAQELKSELEEEGRLHAQGDRESPDTAGVLENCEKDAPEWKIRELRVDFEVKMDPDKVMVIGPDYFKTIIVDWHSRCAARALAALRDYNGSLYGDRAIFPVQNLVTRIADHARRAGIEDKPTYNYDARNALMKRVYARQQASYLVACLREKAYLMACPSNVDKVALIREYLLIGEMQPDDVGITNEALEGYAKDFPFKPLVRRRPAR